MIAFLLGLLKVIGVVLLGLLILLLVIVGIVLFVPIRYSGAGAITEEKKEASAQVTWLLKLIQCTVQYTFPDKPLIVLKVFGLDIMKLLEKSKNKKDNDTVNGSSPASTKDDEGPKPKKPKKAKKADYGINLSLLEPEEEINNETTTSHTIENQPNKQDESDIVVEQSEKKISIKDKLFGVFVKIQNIICNVQYYWEILQEEDTRQLIADAWEAIMKIIKSISPKEFRVEGVFGFASPDTTGKIYGLYAVWMPFIGDYVVLEPDFEKANLKGTVALKGRITIFIIVINALRIVFDKRMQPFIKKLKHGGNENGRK